MHTATLIRVHLKKLGVTCFAYCIFHLELDGITDESGSDFAVFEEMRSFGRLKFGLLRRADW